MEKEDKIAFSLMGVAFSGLVLAGMLGVRFLGGALFGWFDAADDGVGFKSALVSAVILSTLLVLVFAVVAGEGFIGELPSVLIGFFLLTAFFTFSIAWVF